MAFHVACPITCRRICFCKLGFPKPLQTEKGQTDFLDEIVRVEEFLADPWKLKVKEITTVQVVVPKVVPPPTPPNPAAIDGGGGGAVGAGGGGESYSAGDGEELLSVQSKRNALQKRAIAASIAAEDYVRKFEAGAVADNSGEMVQDLGGENQGVKVMCRICFDGENEGSERALRMLACKNCSKKYHTSCLKTWGQHRDLFHLSSWVCPSCRSCEVCRRTGDPTKFMFCKRCDGAYHCYCQQPPHKNVSGGPYLCPKHTRCHSCGSSVPGNGLSTRWFHSYTNCDACGRLFNKGNFCPVCLKVYRDSELTPMVACDDCERWVHCLCDGISDEKYLQFQADRNLRYQCPACRGACYKVKNPEDGVHELWRRRDKADRDQIASLRAAAGLPCEENAYSVSLYSDDEDYSPLALKQEHGRSLKFSVKGSAPKSAKNTKEYGKKLSSKKYGNKKGYQDSSIGKTNAHQSFEGRLDGPVELRLDDEEIDHMQPYRSEVPESMPSPSARNVGNGRENCSMNQSGIMKHNFVEAAMNREDRPRRVVQVKSSKSHDISDGSAKHAGKPETVKGTKLVIHLGSRNRHVTKSPMSDASGCHKEQDMTVSNGSEDTSRQKVNDKIHLVERHDAAARISDGERLDYARQPKRAKHTGREGSLIKLGKVKPEVLDSNSQMGRKDYTDGSAALGKTSMLLENNGGSGVALEPVTNPPTFRNEEVPLRRHSKGASDKGSKVPPSNTNTSSSLDLLPKDPKPLLKLKFKNPYHDNRSSWVPQTEEEKTSVKGQRSKRKRPSSLEKNQVREDEDNTLVHKNNSVTEVMDANWILKKLGKDAIGKRVEVLQPSDSSWHMGVVTDLIEGTSTLAVRLDDGRDWTLELGKQAVRFVPHKRSRT